MSEPLYTKVCGGSFFRSIYKDIKNIVDGGVERAIILIHIKLWISCMINIRD